MRFIFAGLIFSTFAGATLPTSMRAWYADRYPDVVNFSNALNFSTSYPVPTPRAGEVLIEMKASSVNPIDYKILLPILHRAFPIKFPAVFGWEGAGVVRAVSAAATGRLKVGDEVWGALGSEHIGTYADYAVAPEALLSLKPASLSFEEAASLPVVGCTSMQAFDKIQRNINLKGKTVLILGGSGGTGAAAIQLAKNVHSAGKVIATASSSHFDFVKGLGADKIIDYHSENWWEVLQNGTVHAVYDTVGQEGTGPRATGVLAEGGVFITIAHKGPVVGLDSNPKSNVVQVYLQMARNAESLDELRGLVERSELKPTVSKTYPLEKLPAAWAESAAGHVQGKLAVTHSKVATLLV